LLWGSMLSTLFLGALALVLFLWSCRAGG